MFQAESALQGFIKQHENVTKIRGDSHSRVISLITPARGHLIRLRSHSASCTLRFYGVTLDVPRTYLEGLRSPYSLDTVYSLQFTLRSTIYSV